MTRQELDAAIARLGLDVPEKERDGIAAAAVVVEDMVARLVEQQFCHLQRGRIDPLHILPDRQQRFLFRLLRHPRNQIVLRVLLLLLGRQARGRVRLRRLRLWLPRRAGAGAGV
jgi:hypothetical protein